MLLLLLLISPPLNEFHGEILNLPGECWPAYDEEEDDSEKSSSRCFGVLMDLVFAFADSVLAI